jgi:ketosteroid isomerase-like protein
MKCFKFVYLSGLMLSFSLAADRVNASDKILELQEQVFQIETAFAKTMADRDFDAFKSHLSKEAIFLSGKNPRRGVAQISEQWKKYFSDKAAPFSWKPEVVQVLESGTLAISTGPVFNSKGKLFSYYTSTWRLEDDGRWRIIFDKGNKACKAE